MPCRASICDCRYSGRLSQNLLTTTCTINASVGMPPSIGRAGASAPPRLPHSCGRRNAGAASPARAVAPVRYRAARCAIRRCRACRHRSRGRSYARHRSPPRSAANVTAVRHDYGQGGDRLGGLACSHQPVRPHPEPPGAQQRSVPDPQGRTEAAQPSAVRSDDRTDDASGAGSTAAVCRSRHDSSRSISCSTMGSFGNASASIGTTQ